MGRVIWLTFAKVTVSQSFSPDQCISAAFKAAETHPTAHKQLVCLISPKQRESVSTTSVSVCAARPLIWYTYFMEQTLAFSSLCCGAVCACDSVRCFICPTLVKQGCGMLSSNGCCYYVAVKYNDSNATSCMIRVKNPKHPQANHPSALQLFVGKPSFFYN